MVEDGNTSGTKWLYAVEIQSDFKSLSIMQQDIEEYFKEHSVEHAIAIEQAAKIVVRFPDDADARRFCSTFHRPFVGQ